MSNTEAGTPCIEFEGYRDKNGYGRKRRDGRLHLAHRLSYADAHGPIPAGLEVCHHCDNPPCINPEHLFLGTHKENMNDRDRKGRGHHGTRHARAKLDPDRVRQIRALVCAGQAMRAVARHMGVSYRAINAIISGETWAHVT
jgi:hypothetical protein